MRRSKWLQVLSACGLCALILCSGPVHSVRAAAPNWQLIEDDEGIKVINKNVSVSSECLIKVFAHHQLRVCHDTSKIAIIKAFDHTIRKVHVQTIRNNQVLVIPVQIVHKMIE